MKSPTYLAVTKTEQSVLYLPCLLLCLLFTFSLEFLMSFLSTRNSQDFSRFNVDVFPFCLLSMVKRSDIFLFNFPLLRSTSRNIKFSVVVRYETEFTTRWRMEVLVSYFMVRARRTVFLVMAAVELSRMEIWFLKSFSSDIFRIFLLD